VWAMQEPVGQANDALHGWVVEVRNLVLPEDRASQPAGQDWAECRLPGLPQPARCRTLSVPEDPWTKPKTDSGVKVPLAVAMIPALAHRPQVDPVLFLAGGPGQSGLDLAGGIARLLGRELRHRPLILVDLRGSGRSAALTCEGDPGPQTPLAEAMNPTRQTERLRRCLNQLSRRHDLSRYSTAHAVADLEALRVALNVERWNIVAVSYGTRVALEYARLYTKQVRRLVLDGVVPPDMGLPEPR